MEGAAEGQAHEMMIEAFFSAGKECEFESQGRGVSLMAMRVHPGMMFCGRNYTDKRNLLVIRLIFCLYKRGLQPLLYRRTEYGIAQLARKGYQESSSQDGIEYFDCTTWT